MIELGFHPDPLVRVNNGVPRTVTVDTALTEQEHVVEQILTSLLRAAGGPKIIPMISFGSLRRKPALHPNM